MRGEDGENGDVEDVGWTVGEDGDEVGGALVACCVPAHRRRLLMNSFKSAMVGSGSLSQSRRSHSFLSSPTKYGRSR